MWQLFTYIGISNDCLGISWTLIYLHRVQIMIKGKFYLEAEARRELAGTLFCATPFFVPSHPWVSGAERELNKLIGPLKEDHWLSSLQVPWILCILQPVRQLWHWESSNGSHSIDGCSEERLEFAELGYLEQIPPVPGNPNEPASVGMQDVVNAKSPLKQTWGIFTSQHLTNPPCINDESAWGKNSKWAC